MIPRIRPWADYRTVMQALEAGSTAERTAFEHSFAQMVRAKDALATNMGRGALLLGLRALGIARGTEVIVPAIVCNAVVDAVVSAGCIPVPADVDARNLNIDSESVSKATGAKTSAVIAVHSYGVPCQVRDLADFCRERGIYLVEDCAQSMGSKVDARPVGSFGDVGIFSLGFDKILSLGSGGIVVTKDSDTAGRLRALDVGHPVSRERERAHMFRFIWLHGLFNPKVYSASRFLRPRFELLEWPSVEASLPLGPIRSSLGRAVLGKAERIASIHRDHAERILHGLQTSNIRLPQPREADLPSFLRLTVRVPARVRDSLSRRLLNKGFEVIPAAYERPIHQLPRYTSLLRCRVQLAVAEDACRSLINFPTHPYITPPQIEVMCQLARKHVENT